MPFENPIRTAHNVKNVHPDAVQTEWVFRGTESLDKRELKKLLRKEDAAAFVGELRPGFHVWGLTRGQFSLIDTIRAVTDQTGPVAFTLATWTVAKADLSELIKLLTPERFTRIRLLLDCTFQRRQPSLFQHIKERFGADAIRVTHTHAKFMLFESDRWKIICRTSMNLNFNPRIEDIELKDDPALFDFLNGWMDSFWKA